jgi:hypothetical protein
MPIDGLSKTKRAKNNSSAKLVHMNVSWLPNHHFQNLCDQSDSGGTCARQTRSTKLVRQPTLTPFIDVLSPDWGRSGGQIIEKISAADSWLSGPSLLAGDRRSA